MILLRKEGGQGCTRKGWKKWRRKSYVEKKNKKTKKNREKRNKRGGDKKFRKRMENLKITTFKANKTDAAPYEWQRRGCVCHGGSICETGDRGRGTGGGVTFNIGVSQSAFRATAPSVPAESKVSSKSVHVVTYDLIYILFLSPFFHRHPHPSGSLHPFLSSLVFSTPSSAEK